MSQTPANTSIGMAINPTAFAHLKELQEGIGAIQRPVPVARVPQSAVIETAIALLWEAFEDGRLATEIAALTPETLEV